MIHKNIDQPVMVVNLVDALEFHRKKTEDQIKAIELMDSLESFNPVGLEELVKPIATLNAQNNDPI